MKSLLLGGLLAGASLAAQAQTYNLDLTVQPLYLPNRNVSVEVVVDARPGNPPLGIAYRGLGGKSMAIGFAQGPAIALTQFLQARLPARPTDHRVLLCLRALHVSESLGGVREQATADFTADVYERRPDGYHFVQQLSAQARAEGAEVTHLHAGHVAQLLYDGLSQLAHADWPAAATRPARTLAELPTDVPLALSGRRGPAILRESPRRGIYYRFEQFQANRPDTVTRFALDTIRLRYPSLLVSVQWLRVARVQPVVATNSGHPPALAELWGFSDGHQLFIQADKRFFPLMRQGNAFTFVGEAPQDILYLVARAQAQGRAATTGVATVRAVDHTGEPMAYGLDPRTGAIAPYPSLSVPARPDTAYLYLYRPPYTTGPEQLKVYVNGHEAGALRPGQYLEVPWARFGQPLKLCLGGLRLASPASIWWPNTGQLNYLRIDVGHPTQPWQWVPAAQGAADLDELDKQARTGH